MKASSRKRCKRERVTSVLYTYEFVYCYKSFPEHSNYIRHFLQEICKYEFPYLNNVMQINVETFYLSSFYEFRDKVLPHRLTIKLIGRPTYESVFVKFSRNLREVERGKLLTVNYFNPLTCLL